MVENDKMNIVSFAGGTGRFTVLQGLKERANITAFFNITDSGGSSGKLRVEHGILPPGDGNQAVAALAKSPLDQAVFTDRWNGGVVDGHRVSNLLFEVTVRKAKEIYGEEHGMIEAMKYFAERFINPGSIVLPTSTKEGVHLVAKLENGQLITGEHEIDTRGSGSPIIDAFLSEEAMIFPFAEEAINQADLILFGPGDLWTSTIPHILIKGVPEAIRRSKARKMFICNLFTKPGETDGYTDADFAEVVTRFIGCKLDFMIVNSNHLDPELLELYKKSNQTPVLEDPIRRKRYAEEVRIFPLATVIKSVKIEKDGSIRELQLLRNHPEKTAAAIEKTYYGIYEDNAA